MSTLKARKRQTGEITMRKQVVIMGQTTLAVLLVLALQQAANARETVEARAGFLPCLAAFPPGDSPTRQIDGTLPVDPLSIEQTATFPETAPSRADRYPLIVIGTVTKELDAVEAPRPGATHPAGVVVEKWLRVEVAVEHILKGDVPAAVTLQYLAAPTRATIGRLYLLQPRDRVLLFLDESPAEDGSYMLPWQEQHLKVSLAATPAPASRAPASPQDVIHAEMVHGLYSTDAYIAHEIMGALEDREFYSKEAIPVLRDLAKSPDPTLSLHALCLLAFWAKDKQALETVVRRAEAGDYDDEVTVLDADGRTVTDDDRNRFYRYAYNLPGAWIARALAGATYAEAIPMLRRLVETARLESWLRCQALEQLSAFHEEPQIRTWRLALQDSDRQVQYAAVSLMRVKFHNHPTVQDHVELRAWVSQDVFNEDPDTYVRLWLEFLDALEAEQAAAAE
ncbi:MAG TPA: hypothetical protein PKI11_00485 [Candidatus Hydrogenedentes bacterium]|nr:hypothetical protein [Candidatus Hydrogenedentota bacterium]